MSAGALRDALAAAGIAATVEENGRVAVVTSISGSPLDGSARRRLVALAREHGFANIALELAPVDGAAAAGQDGR